MNILLLSSAALDVGGFCTANTNHYSAFVDAMRPISLTDPNLKRTVCGLDPALPPIDEERNHQLMKALQSTLYQMPADWQHKGFLRTDPMPTSYDGKQITQLWQTTFVGSLGSHYPRPYGGTMDAFYIEMGPALGESPEAIIVTIKKMIDLNPFIPQEHKQAAKDDLEGRVKDAAASVEDKFQLSESTHVKLSTYCFEPEKCIAGIAEAKFRWIREGILSTELSAGAWQTLAQQWKEAFYGPKAHCSNLSLAPKSKWIKSDVELPIPWEYDPDGDPFPISWGYEYNRDPLIQIIKEGIDRNPLIADKEAAKRILDEEMGKGLERYSKLMERKSENPEPQIYYPLRVMCGQIALSKYFGIAESQYPDMELIWNTMVNSGFVSPIEGFTMDNYKVATLPRVLMQYVQRPLVLGCGRKPVPSEAERVDLERKGLSHCCEMDGPHAHIDGAVTISDNPAENPDIIARVEDVITQLKNQDCWIVLNEIGNPANFDPRSEYQPSLTHEK